MATNGHALGASTSESKIILYTNHLCPYAHRAHITLEELKLPFEEVIIDLAAPREPWYLEINPRGLVPSIKYSANGSQKQEIITESAIVAQFLADTFPSHLLPASTTNPLRRARIAFFTDTWSTKVSSQMFATIMSSGGPEEKQRLALEWAAAVEKEIEPLLADASPFFGGSSELTMAEVITAPFVLRWEYLSKDGTLLPTVFWEKLSALPNFSKWARAMAAKESVTKIFDGEKFLSGTKARVEKNKAAAVAAAQSKK